MAVTSSPYKSLCQMNFFNKLISFIQKFSIFVQNSIQNNISVSFSISEKNL